MRDLRHRGVCRSGAHGLKDYAYRSPEWDVRAEQSDGQVTITGYAVVFNRYSQNLGGYVEQIAPEAFDESLRDDDQIASYNHDYAAILGRRSAGTLDLEQDSTGIRYTIRGAASDPDIVRVAEKVRAGSVVGSSFTFRSAPGGETWGWTDDDFPLVTVHKARMYEVAPVVWPAYLQTQEQDLAVGLRSLAEQTGRDVDELVAAARAGSLRTLISAAETAERATPGPTVANLQQRMRLLELNA